MSINRKQSFLSLNLKNFSWHLEGEAEVEPWFWHRVFVVYHCLKRKHCHLSHWTLILHTDKPWHICTHSGFVNWGKLSSEFHKITEYSKLEETHKDHWDQFLSEWPVWALNPQPWYYHRALTKWTILSGIFGQGWDLDNEFENEFELLWDWILGCRRKEIN